MYEYLAAEREHREEQIADLEKQAAALEKQLAELTSRLPALARQSVADALKDPATARLLWAQRRRPSAAK